MEFDYITERVKANNLTLLTDLYQLTMMNGYEICGLDKTRAVFDVFYRGNGGEQDVLVKCLLNGREASLPVPTTQYPYYRWTDFRDFYTARCNINKS